MQTIGQALSGRTALAAAADEYKRAQWKVAMAASKDEFHRPRPYKVTLCAMVFSEIEVVGDVTTVDRLAEQQADKATVTMHCLPHAMRFHVQKRTNPKDEKSALEWVEVVYRPVDANDGASPWAWQFKR